jgi:hypothetical protein
MGELVVYLFCLRCGGRGAPSRVRAFVRPRAEKLVGAAPSELVVPGKRRPHPCELE